MSEDRRDESLSWVEPKDQDRKSQQSLIGTQLEDKSTRLNPVMCSSYGHVRPQGVTLEHHA